MEQETAARELEEFIEEYSGEEGLLEAVVNDKGKVVLGEVKARLKALREEPESDEEWAALTRCLALMEAEAAAAKQVREAQAALDEQVLARYATLTEAEIKSLAIDDKWFADLWRVIEGEVQQLAQQLAGRVQELDERYAQPLSALEQEVAAFGAKVEGHLGRMRVVWK